jgi:nucleoside-diphosphate-sugar epimerase
VLLTGVSAYIGSAVVRALVRAGHQVTGRGLQSPSAFFLSSPSIS